MTDPQAQPPGSTASSVTPVERGPAVDSGRTDAPHPIADGAETRLDLERVAADLDGVEAALGRLDDGSYWTDEITGQRIPDDVLAANPVARRTEVGD